MKRVFLPSSMYVRAIGNDSVCLLFKQPSALPGSGPYPVDGQHQLLIPAPASKAAKPKRKMVRPRRCGKCHKTNAKCSRSGTAICKAGPCKGCDECFLCEETGERKLRKFPRKKKPKPI